MPSFSCDGCSDVIKKPKLDNHSMRCRSSVTCLDCSTTFQNSAQWKSHTSCISEAQKYEKSVYKPPKSKKNKQAQQPANGKNVPTENPKETNETSQLKSENQAKAEEKSETNEVIVDGDKVNGNSRVDEKLIKEENETSEPKAVSNQKNSNDRDQKKIQKDSKAQEAQKTDENKDNDVQIKLEPVTDLKTEIVRQNADTKVNGASSKKNSENNNQKDTPNGSKVEEGKLDVAKEIPEQDSLRKRKRQKRKSVQGKDEESDRKKKKSEMESDPLDKKSEALSKDESGDDQVNGASSDLKSETNNKENSTEVSDTKPNEKIGSASKVEGNKSTEIKDVKDSKRNKKPRKKSLKKREGLELESDQKNKKLKTDPEEQKKAPVVEEETKVQNENKDPTPVKDGSPKTKADYKKTIAPEVISSAIREVLMKRQEKDEKSKDGGGEGSSTMTIHGLVHEVVKGLKTQCKNLGIKKKVIQNMIMYDNTIKISL